MAYLIKDLQRMKNNFSVGDFVLIKHTKIVKGSEVNCEEPCEILGIYPNHFLLKTVTREKAQLKFSMKLYDFYMNAFPVDRIRNYEKSDSQLIARECDKSGNYIHTDLLKELTA